MHRLLARPAGLAALAGLVAVLWLGPFVLVGLSAGGIAFAVVVPGARPAGVTAALAGLLGLAAGAVSLNMPPEVAASIVGLAIIAVSVLAPRWAEQRGLFAERPVGVSTAAVVVLVWVAPLAGVDLDQQQATVLVAGVASAVSLITPRQVVTPV